MHWLRLDSFEVGKSFCENSTTLLNEVWRHNRQLQPCDDEDGTVDITDTVEFQPRLPFIGHLLLPVVKFIFQNRHAKLRGMFMKHV